MEISIIQGDLLDSDAQALALTIDGSAPNLEGNIARQFSKRFPNEWAQIESQIDYPMSLGAADSFTFETTNDKCPELVVLLSTCLLYTSPSPRDQRGSRMPSSA